MATRNLKREYLHQPTADSYHSSASRKRSAGSTHSARRVLRARRRWRSEIHCGYTIGKASLLTPPEDRFSIARASTRVSARGSTRGSACGSARVSTPCFLASPCAFLCTSYGGLGREVQRQT